MDWFEWAVKQHQKFTRSHTRTHISPASKWVRESSIRVNCNYIWIHLHLGGEGCWLPVGCWFDVGCKDDDDYWCGVEQWSSVVVELSVEMCAIFISRNVFTSVRWVSFSLAWDTPNLAECSCLRVFLSLYMGECVCVFGVYVYALVFYNYSSIHQWRCVRFFAAAAAAYFIYLCKHSCFQQSTTWLCNNSTSLLLWLWFSLLLWPLIF